jgi:hypothetical protein
VTEAGEAGSFCFPLWAWQLHRHAAGSRSGAGDANSEVSMGGGSELAGGWVLVPLKLGCKCPNLIARDLDYKLAARRLSLEENFVVRGRGSS